MKEFLFVTANKHERTAFLEKFVLVDKEYILGKEYYIGRFGSYSVAYIHIEEQGVTAPASTPLVGELVRKLRPVAVVMVGIAFGADSTKQKIGDVLISSIILPHDSRKELENHTEYKDIPKEPGYQLLNAFRDCYNWSHYLENDEFSVIHMGAVLTGSPLINSYEYRTKLLNDFADYKPIGGEMEAQGIYSSCRLHGVAEWIIVKGICDWAYNKGTASKDKDQKMATKAAVAYCFDVFSRVGVFADLLSENNGKMTGKNNESIPVKESNELSNSDPKKIKSVSFDYSTITNMATLRKLLRDHTAQYEAEIMPAVRRMASRNNGELRKLCQELITADRTNEALFDAAIRALADGNQNELLHVFEYLYSADRAMFDYYFFEKNLLTNEKLRTQLMHEFDLSRIETDPLQVVEEKVWDVFLSCSLKDKIKAASLKSKLEEHGIRVWFEPDQTLVGDSIPKAFEYGIENSRHIIVCLSPDYVQSEWASLARYTSLILDPNNSKRTIIPIVFRKCSLPVLLRHLKSIDYLEPNDSVIKEIVRVIKTGCTNYNNSFKTTKNTSLPQQDYVTVYHFNKKNNDAVNRLSVLLRTLRPKSLYYPNGLFTCFFFDALTNWSYHYNDDLFKEGRREGNKDFIDLMNNIYDGKAELPAYLRMHLKDALEQSDLHSIEDFLNTTCEGADISFIDEIMSKHEYIDPNKTLAEKIVKYIKEICESYKFSDFIKLDSPNEIPYADHEYPPWAEFAENTGRAGFEEVSRFWYDVRATALCGRFDEINCLIEFCNTNMGGAPFQWYAISGVGGSGKSRIANELSEWIKKTKPEQWNVFWVNVYDTNSKKMKEAIEAVESDRSILIVLDSNKHYLKGLRSLIMELYQRSIEKKKKVRLLLVERYQVERNELGWGRDIIASQFVPKVFSSPDYIDSDGLMFLGMLDDTILLEIISSYAKGTEQKSLNRTETQRILLGLDIALKLPLYVEYIADAMLRQNKEALWDKRAVMEYAANYDLDYIQEGCSRLIGLKGNEQDALYMICKDLLLMTSLLPMVSWDDFIIVFPRANRKLERYTEAQELNDPRELLSECLGYTIDENIISIWPDMVCEDYAVRYFTNKKYRKDEKMNAIKNAAAIDFDGLWDRADRIRNDYYHKLEAENSLHYFQHENLIDAYKGNPFISFCGFKWDRIDKPNSCNQLPALIITREIAFKSAYMESGHSFNWEKSLLRERLNGSFYIELSKKLELEYPDYKIAETQTQNGAGTGQQQHVYENTQVADRVFILSEDEARSYFGLPENWIIYHSVQSKKLIAVSEGNPKYPCRWWLRSSGVGYGVSRDGTIGNVNDYPDDEEFGVRPVLWLSTRESGDECECQ